MKFLIPLFFFISIPAMAIEAINDKFTYTRECRAVVTEAARKGASARSIQKRFAVDLKDLDTQIKTINDSTKDPEYRQQTMATAQTWRQAIEWDLTEFLARDKATALEIIEVCGLAKINQPFKWSRELEASLSRH